jgi:hypothetical protein
MSGRTWEFESPRGQFSNHGNSFDTRRRCVRIASDNPAPRRPCRDALALVGADLSARLSERRNPTVLPFACAASPARFRLCLKSVLGSPIRGKALDWPMRLRTQRPLSHGEPMRADTVSSALSERVPRPRWADVGLFHQENRRNHHDRLARTRDLGRGRARAVWSIRRAQEPAVSIRLALDFSSTADEPAGRIIAGRARFAAAVECGRTRAQSRKEGETFSVARKPPVLVLDDPRRDRRGCRNRRPNVDRQRSRPWAHTLRRLTNYAHVQSERVVQNVATDH